GELGHRLAHVIVAAAAARGHRRRARLLLTHAAAASPAAEQHHAIAADLRGVALLPFLVGPLAGLQPSFDVDLLALGEVLVQALGGLAPVNDAVPLGLLLPLAA